MVALVMIRNLDRGKTNLVNQLGDPNPNQDFVIPSWTKLVVNFMTLRAFPFMALWFYGSVVLWFCGSMVIRPHSAPVLASAHPGASLGHDFMTFSGFSRLFCPPTLPLGEFGPKTLWVCILSLGLSTIKVWVMSRLC